VTDTDGETRGRPDRPPRRGLALLVEQVATAWALAGGAVLLAIVAINTFSVVSRALGGRPFAGAFELTETGVAVAAFTFLPYCQLMGANVTADIFTARASRRTVAAFALLAAIIALLFALLLAQRMYLGLLDQRSFRAATTILQVPIWWAFVPIVTSLLLLALAAAVTLAETARDMVRR
jgi:TRAP-type C4-dicarboxylate transport system permease small subunit